MRKIEELSSMTLYELESQNHFSHVCSTILRLLTLDKEGINLQKQNHHILCLTPACKLSVIMNDTHQFRLEMLVLL